MKFQIPIICRNFLTLAARAAAIKFPTPSSAAGPG